MEQLVNGATIETVRLVLGSSWALGYHNPVVELDLITIAACDAYATRKLMFEHICETNIAKEAYDEYCKIRQLLLLTTEQVS